MKILYICHEPLPSPHTNTEQAVKSLAALCRETTYKIDLVCPKKIIPGLNKLSYLEHVADFYDVPSSIFENGIHLIERPIPFFIPGKIGRLYHDILAVFYGKRYEYDLVYTRDPATLAFSLAIGKKTVFETYRYDFITAIKYIWWRKFCTSHDKLAGIITHSEKTRRFFLQAGIPPDKVITAYNGGPSNRQVFRTRPESARRKLTLPESKNILIYSGHINRKKGLGVLIEMARLLENVQFFLVGGLNGSAEVKKITRLIKRMGLSNISLIPRVPPSQIFLFLSAADLLVIPPTSRPMKRFKRTVIPMKTFLYLAAGKPILAPDLPDIKEILKDRHNAILVPPDSPRESAIAIRNLFKDKILQEKLKKQALNDSRLYTWQKRGKKIAEFLERI
ncbi:MAG: glycosyltransferase [Candidatus Aminicenantes bacterium]|nr:glycosyltransferase [Candidatus Aminicenantes bacterium]